MASYRYWLRRIFSFLMKLAFAYAVFSLVIFFYQSNLLYYPEAPTRQVTTTPKAAGLAYERVEFLTEDGVRLDGWFVPAKDARGVLLHFHGNAGNISHRLGSIQIFNRLRLSTFIFDYRGYGRSEGEVSEQGTYRDADAAWRYLTEVRGVPKEKIVLFGRSLGGAVAAYAASRHRPAALILESVFTSVPDVAARIYWYLPVRLLARFGYETKEFLRSVAAPVLIVHSRGDEIIPFRHGSELFEIANAPKRFLEIEGGHNGGFLRSGRTYIDGLDDFLKATLGR